MSCPSCVNASCPEVTPEVTVNEYTVDAASTLAITVTGNYGGDPAKTLVSIQAADAGNWLLRVWLTDAATVTDQETLTPPDQPGAASFFKVTDATGLAAFVVTHSVADSWYVHAALCGAVVTSAIVSVAP